MGMFSSIIRTLDQIDEAKNKNITSNKIERDDTNISGQNNKKDDLSLINIKKIEVSSACVACGMCIMMTDLLKENPNGKVSAVEPAIVTNDKLSNVIDVINNCPVKAISLVDAGLVRARGKEGIEELKKIVIEKMSNYKMEFPNSKEYEFNKAEFSTPTAYGSGEYRYEYKSDNKAVQAGLREFDRIMYSQRKAIIQQLLIEYKNKKLRKYSYYEKEEGNFYYDINQSIQKFLKQAVAEAKELSGNKISLPVNFDTFEVVPEMGVSGDAINRELYVYQLRHIEELWFIQSIMNELESLSWYDTYIDTDDMEDYRGKDVYCYKDISGVCSMFGGHILDECSYVLTGSEGIRRILESPINKFSEQVEKEIKKKVDILINAINKCVLTKSEANVEVGNIKIKNKKIKENTDKQKHDEHKNQEKEFNKDGYNKYGFKANGKSRWGTDYNDRGFKQNGYHNNGTRYDFKGYDIDGYDKNGLNRYGRNKNGFNKNGYHKNGTKYDDNGYDMDGFNVIGFNKNKYYRNGTKYDSKGYDIDGYDKNGFSINGFNKEGVNKKGFNKKGQHINGTNYDFDGYDMKGYDKNGFNRNGFKKDGYHMNGTKYDSEGYNMQGLDRYGFHKNGYDRNGYDKNGYNKNGFDKNGYDENGYDKNGFDKNGYDRNGYNKNGFDRHGFKSNGKSRWGTDYNDWGFKKDGYHMNGTKYNKLGYDINGFDKFGNRKK